MGCLSATVNRATAPMTVSVGLVSVGLVCSVGEEKVRLFSRDGFRLISQDGYLLYGKNPE